MVVVVDLNIFGNSGGPLHDPDGFIIIADRNVLESGIPAARCRKRLTHDEVPFLTTHTRFPQGPRRL
jgi:hypothetical protein